MKDHRTDFTTAYIVGIFVLFLAGLMALVLYGARTYGDTVDSQTERNNRRALLSHVSVSVRNHDQAGSVAVQYGVDGDTLILRDQFNDSAFTTCIYLADGKLVEEFGRSGTERGQGMIQEIGACSSFTIQPMSSQCLRILVDDDEILLRLRSAMDGFA